MMSEHRSRLNGLHGSSIDPIGRDVVPLRSGAYGLNDISAYGVTAEPAYGVTAEPSRAGLTGGMSTRGYLSPLDDPVLRQRRDFHVGLSPVPPGNLDGIFERHDSERIVNGISLPSRETNMLFVDGLPTDCTRREVGHIFRPFIGFKDIKVIHKEPRRSGDKAMVLCFVEFNDSKCALTAMDALQGYKFDDKKPDSPILRIQFAHFPFRLPSELDDQRLGSR